MRRMILFVAATMILPAWAGAQPQSGDFEITLSGSGSANRKVNAGTFNMNGSIGYFITPMVVISFRQNVGYSDFNAGTAWNASSRGAIDLQFNIDRFAPYIGGNIGYVYGDGVKDTWEAAPEAGVKFYVTDTGKTFIYAQAEYQFFFAKSSDVSNAFDKGQFVFSLGIGFNIR